MAVFGLGVDVMQASRIEKAVTRTPKLLTRLWTDGERRRCHRPDGTWDYPRLAARFASKEAVAKALGTGIRGFGFADVEVVREPGGRPAVQLHNGAADVAARLGVVRIHLAITHSGDLSIAYAMAET